MAVDSISASEHNISEKSDQKKKQQMKDSKRTMNPAGAGSVNGRIYIDPENAKTCHQCRQKTRNFAAACKNHKNNKLCPLTFCRMCLLNRYGEKAEEVEVLKDWSCPKCRGICNCSVCRKRSGHQPTGVLLHKAKATGYSSVSELLHVKGPGNFGNVKNVKDVGALPKKQAASEKDTLLALPRYQGKENLVNGKIYINLDLPLPSNHVENKPKKMNQEGFGRIQGVNLEDDALMKGSPSPDEKKPKKLKQGALKKMHDGQEVSVAFLEQTGPDAGKEKTKKLKWEELSEMDDGALLESSPKKPRILNKSNNTEMKKNEKFDGVLEEGEGPKTMISMKVALDPFEKKSNTADRDSKTHKNMKALDSKKIQNDGAQHKMVVESHKDKMHNLQFQNRDRDADILLPNGTELRTVAGIELSIKDVGNALQFFEFCAAFGKILNVKKGQSKLMLQELINGQSRRLRRAQYSAVVQFHIQLLSLIQNESGSGFDTLSPTHSKNSWLCALKNCIFESQNELKSLPLDREAGGYDTLDFSTKLKLLNFLCDEVLETVIIRKWIDEQNLKFAEKAKEAKERVLAAKDKEKRLRQKMVDEVAQAIIAKNGAPLSISEHDKLVGQIKSEAAQAHAEMLESLGMMPKNEPRPDAIRTEPILLDFDGHAYWRLNSYSDKSNVLIQDIGTGDDAVALGEKWFTLDAEQLKVIEKHISLRKKDTGLKQSMR